MMLRLLGRVSVRAAPVSAYAFELLTVTVSVATPFCVMVLGENACVTEGATGTVTTRAAALVAVLPPAGPVLSAFGARLFV